MRMIRKIIPILGGIFTSADFTYTGTYTWVDDGSGNFRLKFLTSGTFTPKKRLVFDLFIVGGGAGGASSGDNVGRGGGGGGYTGTWSSISIVAGTAYPIVIGDGGAVNSSGGTSSAFGYSKNGGVGDLSKSGQNGGSGSGMAGNSYSKNGTAGGSNGSNGATNNQYTVGIGQGSTTREFGEASGALYGGAGGGGAYDTNEAVGGAGGDGGGGAGGNRNQNGVAGTANTGGGGGGGGSYHAGGAGGSGIVIIRNHRV